MVQPPVTHDPRERTARGNLTALLLKYQRFGELVTVMEETGPSVWRAARAAVHLRSGAPRERAPEAAIRTLLRAKDVCKNSKTIEVIEESLRKARAEPPELDATRIIRQPDVAVTHEEFMAVLDGFSDFVRSEHRMSFWTTKATRRKFVSCPEQHGKVMFHAFLRESLATMSLSLRNWLQALASWTCRWRYREACGL